MRQRCEHGYVTDPEDRCPECQLDALRKDNERLRAALRWYAEEYNYTDAARAALAAPSGAMDVHSIGLEGDLWPELCT